MVELYIHASLTRFTDNQPSIKLPIHTIDELIPALCQEYPKLTAAIMTPSGKLTPYVNCYINGENIKTLAEGTLLVPGTKADLVTSLVGG